MWEKVLSSLSTYPLLPLNFENSPVRNGSADRYLNPAGADSSRIRNRERGRMDILTRGCCVDILPLEELEEEEEEQEEEEEEEGRHSVSDVAAARARALLNRRDSRWAVFWVSQWGYSETRK